MIVTEGLTKRFGDLVAVDHLDIHVNEGDIYGFLAVSYTHLTLPTTPYV